MDSRSRESKSLSRGLVPITTSQRMTMEPNPKSIIPVSELQLGDKIRLGEYEYADATVYRLEANGDRHIVRPYIHVSDVAYTGPSLIPYLGWEDFVLYSKTTVTLIRRGEPPK